MPPVLVILIIFGAIWLFGALWEYYEGSRAGRRGAVRPKVPADNADFARTPPQTEPAKVHKPAPSLLASPDILGIEINDDFRAALELIEQKNQSLFITGKAGTGKSTLLRYFRATTKKSVVVLAPTGLAAISVGGQTIHSFFRFPPRLIDPQSLRPSRNAGLFRRLDTLVIDEVSMVRADLMDGIDTALRLNRGKPNTPFGGVQVILIGDLFQLPPIVRGQELRGYFAGRYGGPYFFRAPVFSQTQVHMIDLQKVYRQTEANFLTLLNAIRDGRADNGVLELLRSRVRKFKDLEQPEEYVTLTTTNQAAFEINMRFLERLPDPENTFEAIVSGKFDDSSFPTDPTLRLKVGAHVMMLRNDPNKRWVNGSIGVINEVSPNRLCVEIKGVSYEIERHSWENVEYFFNREENRVDQRVIGSFQQYPLRLAWAITIHKSQGQTLDRIYLDLGSGAFAHGQTYVALSRCRSLGGLALSRPVFASDVIVDEAVYEYKNIFAPTGSGPANRPNSSANVRLVVSQAYSQKRRLRIEYRKPEFQGRQSETTLREIDVYAVGEDYLDAFCHFRHAQRTFKLDRIVSARMLQQSYQVPTDHTPSTWVLYSKGIVDSSE
ncbi:MAG: AAA family ATPase [Chloroflexi bacterium]|nr:AAA family ATPase [Chloroflexota bacterium]